MDAASVEFPHLRPGGEYLIEDWSWTHTSLRLQRGHPAPLTNLIVELVIAAARRAVYGGEPMGAAPRRSGKGWASPAFREWLRPG
jgi:hypothetical protein